MSALPVKRVVVAHPSALKKHMVAGAQVVASLPAAVAAPMPVRREPPAWLVRVFAMALGLALFVALWAFVAKFCRIPDPVAVVKEAAKLFADPFYRNGPNDQGIGWNVVASLRR